tara:strand:- start:378 stop:1562 length:1185 start_codon:yes stop_codon:yes gene_type:complete
MFEQTELFRRGVGEGTDVVQKEMYNFKDLGNNELTLRPEGTASVCRAFIEHGMHNEAYPVRLFYLGPMFRHERPQSGRLRQHHQFGVEIFGDPSPEADVEIINLGLSYLSNLGLRELTVKVNSIGSGRSREKFQEALVQYLIPFVSKFSNEEQKKFKINPIRILDSKEKNLQDIIKGAPKPIDFLEDESKEHWDSFLNILSSTIKLFDGFNYEIDPNLVRGLDYYTNTVFEIQPFDSRSAQSSVLSGGRYDNLVESIGGPKTPAAGFGSGLERAILNLMKQPEYQADTHNLNGPKLMIVPLSEKAKLKAAELAKEMRRNNISIVIGPQSKSIKGQLRYANAISAQNLLIFGDKELEINKTLIKLKFNSNSVNEQSVAIDSKKILDKLTPENEVR